jgi:hypothetical protein
MSDWSNNGLHITVSMKDNGAAATHHGLMQPRSRRRSGLVVTAQLRALL